ncbi:hypothetical protein F5Y19DRAFT_407106 [Xylariaceae sp. FL1651]|nr:hypothetical protein F5Y19DRAFT_407106 [Xylariaceae sp. FL1651]
MKFFALSTLLAASLTLASPVPALNSAVDSPAVEKRGYAALFCAGLCAAAIENPPVYAACVTACLATGSESGGSLNVTELAVGYSKTSAANSQ